MFKLSEAFPDGNGTTPLFALLGNKNSIRRSSIRRSFHRIAAESHVHVGMSEYDEEQ